MIYNALEQFEIVALVNLNLGFLDISISNATIFSFLSSFFILIGFQFISVNNGGFFIPTRFQVIYESLYSFVLNIVNEIIGKKGQTYFPFMLALFCFLLVANLMGIVPYSFTITSHVILTFTISLIIFVGRVFIGFSNHGLKYFGLLVPSGVPIAIVPALVIIEFLSFCIPLLALGVRLFANIMSGHILLKVIVGFCWSIITTGGVIFLIHFIPIGVLFLLLFLETAVAIIQAYIFTILSCMYIGESVSGGH